MAIPNQNIRNLSCSARLFSPCQQAESADSWREKKERRNRHGSARAIEDLRRVRQFVVPRPVGRVCLLQELYGEIKRFPHPAEQAAERASEP